jgi:hypothetical protein
MPFGSRNEGSNACDDVASTIHLSILHGANTALRGRCQELDGEVQASRQEASGLRRRLDALEGDKVPHMTDLVSAALAQVGHFCFTSLHRAPRHSHGDQYSPSPPSLSGQTLSGFTRRPIKGHSEAIPAWQSIMWRVIYG